MLGRILDGKAVAARSLEATTRRAADFLDRYSRRPGLDVVLVGEDAASQVYVASKERTAERCGIRGRVHRLPESTSQRDLQSLLLCLNSDPEVDGVLLQLPLPATLMADAALEHIAVHKDVDGLHPLNAGRLAGGQPGLRPCTPLGCLDLVDSAAIELCGARALVIGRSRLVGIPVARLLLERNATVTLAHSKSRDLPALVGEAEILVVAAGKPKLVPGEWIRTGAVVLDVGIHRVDGALCGDVDFATARHRAAWITPVPGGVGPMTIAMLLRNTMDAAEAASIR